MRSRGLYEENHNGNLHHLTRRDPQDATANLWAGREVAGEGLGTCVLAGGFAAEGFAGSDNRRRASRTCNLRDRVFEGPG